MSNESKCTAPNPAEPDAPRVAFEPVMTDRLVRFLARMDEELAVTPPPIAAE